MPSLAAGGTANAGSSARRRQASTVDEGATAAVLERGGSLLPGIRVTDNFCAGEVIKFSVTCKGVISLMASAIYNNDALRRLACACGRMMRYGL